MTPMVYDAVVIGAGPAGIFTALELTKLAPEKTHFGSGFRQQHRQTCMPCQNQR